MQPDWLAPLAPEASMRRRGVQGLLWFAIGQTGKIALLIASTMVLLRLLPPSDFGLVAMAATMTSFLILFRDAGLTNATVQQKHLSQTQVSTLFWLNQLLAVGLAFLTLLAAGPMAWFYGEPALSALVAVLAVGFLFGGIGVQHEALLRRAMHVRKLAVLEITSVAAGGLAAIAMALTGWGWWALAAQRLVQLLVYGIGCWLACSWRPTLEWNLRESRSQVTFGAQISGFNFVNFFARNGDNILIGWYWGATLLGVYAKAYDMLLAPLQQLSAPLANTLQPILGRLRDEPERYRKAFLKAYTPAVLAMLPVGAVMFMLPESVVAVVFGKGWEAATPVVQWLGIAVAVQLVGSGTGTLFLSQQRGRDYAVTGLITSTITVASFIIGLPYGIASVAGCYVVGYLFLQLPVIAHMGGRTGPVKPTDIWQLMVPSLLCAGACLPMLLAYSLASENWSALPRLALGCILAVAACLACLPFIPACRNILADLHPFFKRSK